MSGALFKRCGCTESVTRPDGTNARRQLGDGCPQLRRADGSWNPRHGTWGFQVAVPTPAGARRVHLRQGGHPTREDAEKVLRDVEALLVLAEAADDPDATRVAIADLIRPALAARTTLLPHLDELRRRIGLGRPVDQHVTVETFLRDWLDRKKNLRRNTRRSYQQQINNHLIPRLGEHRLDRLTGTHVQKALDAITEEAALIADQNNQRRAVLAESKAAWREHRSVDARRARALLCEMPPLRRVQNPATIQRIRACLRSALTDAQNQQLVTDNAARHVHLAPGRAPKPRLWTDTRVTEWRDTGVVPFPVMVWSAEHTTTFLTSAKKDPLYSAFMVVAYAGLRRGEVCALRWADIDFATGRIEITQQLVQYGWEADIQDETKTHAGDRVVIAVQPVLKALAKQRKKQQAQQAAAGEKWTKTGLVFTTDTGAPIHPSQLTDALREIARRVGLPPVRLHDLRHGTATHALSAGVDMKTVSEMLGHSSITITADTYTSVADELKRAAADKIADQLAHEDDDDEDDDGEDQYHASPAPGGAV
jgi:integrase